MTDDEIKHHLESANPEFRKLVEEHKSCESRLTELYGHHMSESQHVEEVTLKKRKLQLKDHMSQLIRKYRDESLSHA